MTWGTVLSDSEIDRCLKRYLLAHESDIAMGENNFGELKGTFEGMIGREARE